ncbi:UNVERIFIED_CONTAM: hypothetical protein FKN15_036021 [Acipenser sinensis]
MGAFNSRRGMEKPAIQADRESEAWDSIHGAGLKMEQTAERFGVVSRRGGEGESVRAALEELRQWGKEVGEAIAGKHRARRKMAARGVTDRRGEVKDGWYDGRSDWEAYWAKFQIVGQTSGWSQRERAMQLITALEGEALRALLDLNEMELAHSQAVLTALDRRFGSAEPAVNLRQRMASRSRRPGEKLGMFAAEVPVLHSGGPGRSGD